MGLIDFILNVAGLLLWLNWRSLKLDPMAAARPSTLAGTLRRADPPLIRRWHFPAALVALLVLRAFFYWQIGSPMNWSATLSLAAISVSFTSFGPDALPRMMLFSVLSFGLTLAVFQLWMLLLSLASRPGAEFDGARKFVRLHIGRVDDWPSSMKVLLPLFGVGGLWWLLSWWLAHWEILPRPISGAHRLEQSLLIGLGSYLVWKYIITGVLTLHLVNSYVFLGNHPLWSSINAIGREMLKPLRWLPLSIGKVDFAPVVMIVLVLLLSQLIENGLNVLPWSETPAFKIPGLVDLYRMVSP
jgi:uncharacterized protein YggT (Ycf19 family)